VTLLRVEVVLLTNNEYKSVGRHNWRRRVCGEREMHRLVCPPKPWTLLLLSSSTPRAKILSPLFLSAHIAMCHAAHGT